MTKEEFKDKFIKYTRKLGWTVEETAQQLFVSKATVLRWAEGASSPTDRQPTIEYLERVYNDYQR